LAIFGRSSSWSSWTKMECSSGTHRIGLFRGFLERPGLAEEFVRTLNSGRTKSLRTYPGIVTEAITTSHTNAHALREMDRLNLEALVVVNDAKRVAGIVERDQVLSKMLLALVP
jgi:hypothetical protein